MDIQENTYNQAKSLLKTAQSPNGFLASVNDVANYKRIWARDGVICGLAEVYWTAIKIW